MKNISLFLKIVLSYTVVMMTFMTIFIYQNYETVYKQMESFENKKFVSIAKTVEPVISINLSLGLKSGYIETLEQLISTHPEIMYITLSDKLKQTIYEKKQLNIDSDIFSKKHLHSYEIAIQDRLLNSTSAYMNIYYTHSIHLKTIVEKYKYFMLIVFVLFFISIFIFAILVYYAIRPLARLTKTLASYKPGAYLKMLPMQGKSEVSVINNTTVDMLDKIDEYTKTLESKVSQRTQELNNANLELTKTKNNLQQLNSKLEVKIEEELTIRMKFEKELAHKSHLASMGEMIDNIAHQWRQPLMNINSILINIDRAYEIGKLDEYYLEKKIKEAVNVTTHMSQTIEDFRHFFRKDKKLQNININKILQQSFELLSNVLEEITICFDTSNHFTIIGYKNELIQVIISMLTNAIDVLNQRDIKEKKIFLSIKDSEQDIKIIIEDNAGGINIKDIKRVFEPYYSTKHQYGGTGLGLYICKVIIEENMNGTIKVSNTDKGAQFIITLKKDYDEKTA